MKIKSILTLAIIGVIAVLLLAGCGKSGWDASKLQLAGSLDSPTDIALTLDSFENRKSIVVTLANNSDKIFYYTEAFALQVKLGDSWYEVPSDLAFIEPAYELQPGMTAQKEFDISSYGKLPTGTYRVVAWGLAAEFEVK